MTLDEAIDYIETRVKDLAFQGFDREAQALRLGIEALKLYMALKATGGVPRGFSGIGETKE